MNISHSILSLSGRISKHSGKITCHGGPKQGETQLYPVKDFVIHLDTMEDLVKKYRGIYKLHLRSVDEKGLKASHYRKCANSEELEIALLEWELSLNKISSHEPNIRVENLVDDCHPPKHFQYVLENIVSCDITDIFNEDYSLGCSCKRCTPKVCIFKIELQYPPVSSHLLITLLQFYHKCYFAVRWRPKYS